MDKPSLNVIPTSRWARWLTGSSVDVPEDLRATLVYTYVTSVTSLVSGTIANLGVTVVAAIRQPTPVFYSLLALDLVLIVVRTGLLHSLRHACATGKRGPTGLFALSGLAWSIMLGVLTFFCFASGDHVLQVVAPVSLVAIAGGLATRNYGLPRLAILQIVVMGVPHMVAVLLFRAEPWLLITVLQFPAYLLAMGSTVFRLHRTFITVVLAERENEHRATHDALTGLWNRPGLMNALQRNLSRSDPDRRFALLYLDLDGFKAINDALGHAAGDRLLQLVGSRLEGVVPPASIVARLGGDEFVILAPAATRGEAEAIGCAAIEITSRPYDLGHDRPALIGVSIGLAWADPDLSADELLARADAALYRAKAGGKGRIVVAALSGDAEPRAPRQRAA